MGDVALIDSARPVTYVNDGHEQWLSLQLPRQPLISHLGFEPRGGSLGRQGTRAGRLLHQLIMDTAEDERSMSETVDIRFDVRRDNAGRHMAFGAGPHECLGIHLARLEMRSLFSALARKVKRFHIEAEQRALNNVLRGFGKLIVTVE